MAADLRFALLTRLAGILCPDYPMKWPQLDWVHDGAFRDYLSKFGEVGAHNGERRWTMAQMLRLTAGVAGDTAECGVFEGAGSYLICRANAGRRMHHVFDSFEGISQPGPGDGTYWTKGALATPESVVAQNLAAFAGHVTLHKGWIPDRFGDVGDAVFSFVHIDVDLEQPTADSIAFFYPRMSPGGIIVCDDYGFSTCPGATRAVDAYLADKPEKMIESACGSGFLIKGVATAAPAGTTPRGLDVTKPAWSSIAARTAGTLVSGAVAAVTRGRRG